MSEEAIINFMMKKTGLKNYKEVKCEDLEKKVGEWRRNLVYFGPTLDKQGFMDEGFRMFNFLSEQT
jgi:hypothetical protein